MEVGIKGDKQIIVTENLTAKMAGSGTLEVFATPYMVALMEATAYESVEPFLEEGQGTVGTKLEISHMAATPVGMEVICKSELVEINKRKLVFKVEAFDKKEKIGEGIHERFIVDNEKFIRKANSKSE